MQHRQPFSGGWCLPNLCDILPPQIQLIGTPVCVEIDAIQVCGLGEQLLSNPCDTLHPEYRCQHCLFVERFAVSGWLLQVQQPADEADGRFGNPLFCQLCTAQAGLMVQQNAQIQLIGTPVCVEIDAIQVRGLGEQLLSNLCDTLHPEYRCQHCLFVERFAVSGWLLLVQQPADEADGRFGNPLF